MGRKYISGKALSNLYKFLKDNGGSYNDLTIFFQNSGIQRQESIKSEATSNKYQFLDQYIMSLNLEQLEDAQKLVSFVEQVAAHPDASNSFNPVAEDLLASLGRDGWEIGSGTISWQENQEGISSARVTMILPSEVTKLLETLIFSLPRAMYPLKNRRQGASFLAFDNEYDVQDLLHAMLRPWINDIRPEEYTPSYAGSSTRIDFLLAEHDTVIEVKYVRDTAHAKAIGNELIIDIAHYKVHPSCKSLWIVIYDPKQLVRNPGGLTADLERATENIKVRVFVIPS